MKRYTEVRWHGRGGQGTVTAAKMLAEAALGEGKYVQAFPEYGPERMGAPLRAFNRLSSQPILIHCQVTQPDMVVVVDSTLSKNPQIIEGTSEETVFILNTISSPEEIKSQLGLADNQPVYVVDATKIAMDTIGRPMPNTPLLGALAKVSGFFDIERLQQGIKKSFERKFGEKVVNANLQAVTRAYREVYGG